MAYKKYNTHSKLRTVVLGSFYTPDYFDFVTEPSVRNPLQQIAAEINHDLDYFHAVLSNHGCKVLRPKLLSKKDFLQYLDTHGSLPLPPLQPRNHFSVVKDTLYQITAADDQFIDCINHESGRIVDLSTKNHEFFDKSISHVQDCYNPDKNIWYSKKKYLSLAGPDWPSFDAYVRGQRSFIPDIKKEMESFTAVLQYETKEFRHLQGPNIFPTDSGLVIDCNEYCDYASWFRSETGYRDSIININTTAGHTDGCFVVLGNHTILGIHPLIDYGSIFPDHTVIQIPNSNYLDHILEYKTAKSTNGGHWWIHGQEQNKNLVRFVDTYIKDWTGHIYETIFDVNVLAIDDNNICTIGSDRAIIKQLNQRGIQCIEIPWRHRFFVDCGLHCLTLDLVRDA